MNPNPIDISFQRTPRQELPPDYKAGVSIVVNGHTFAILEAKSEFSAKAANTFGKFIGNLSSSSADQAPKLNINKWIPIKLDNDKIVYIKTKELFQKTLLGNEEYMTKTLRRMISQNDKDRVGFSADAGKIFEGRSDLLDEESRSIESQAELMTAYLTITLMNEGTVFDTRPQLHHLFNEPLKDEVRESINLTEDLPSYDMNAIGDNQELIDARSASSSTISKNTPESLTAYKNWIEADHLVRTWAQENRLLDIEDIQTINKILTTGLQNNEGIPGELRENGCNVRPGGQAQFVLGGYVHEEMKIFHAWLNEQLILCDRKEANPVEVAARAAQRLISIHPFADGNGRTTQFLMNFILQRSGLPPATLSSKEFHFAVHGGIPENDEINTSVNEGVTIVKNGIINTCNIAEIKSPFLNE